MTGTRNETGLSTALGALGGVAAILVVVLGVVVVQRSTDDPEPGAASDEAGTSQSAASGDSDPDGWVAEAKEAGSDGFPAFVPAKVPHGWTPGPATYEPDTSWHFELTAPSGATVTIEQRSSASVPEVVDEVIGDAETAGTVDLRRYGTGSWDAYESAEGQALGKWMAETAVVVGGDATQDEVVALTRQLLTVEMLVNHDDGSDG